MKLQKCSTFRACWDVLIWSLPSHIIYDLCLTLIRRTTWIYKLRRAIRYWIRSHIFVYLWHTNRLNVVKWRNISLFFNGNICRFCCCCHGRFFVKTHILKIVNAMHGFILSRLQRHKNNNTNFSVFVWAIFRFGCNGTMAMTILT